MTVPELFFYITTGIVLQGILFGGVAFHRHWREYQALKRRVADEERHRPGDQSGHPRGWEGLREFRVQRKVFEDASRSICSLYLVPTDGQALPDFHPGQFLPIQFDLFDSATGQPVPVTRCYSLSDRPGLGHYRISVKRVSSPAGRDGTGPGRVSQHVHDGVHAGSRLMARAPEGQFFLEAGHASPVVLIAGGIGITPLLSMLSARLEQGDFRETWLFYGLRNSGEHMKKEYLESLAERHAHFHLRICYSQPLPEDVPGRDFQHAGHVDITLLRLSLKLQPYRFHVCGPKAMLESIIPALEIWGVPEDAIHFEAFGPSSLVRAAHQQTALPGAAARNGIQVTFRQSGRTLPWDEQAGSLLEFAERNGIAVASGCRAGGCGTCQTALHAGEVEYLQTPAIAPKPGHCLLCIAKPKRDLSLAA